MNPLFGSSKPQQSSNPLNPMQLIQQMQQYQGTPEQAKDQFIKTIVDSGMSRQELDNLLDQIDNIGSQMKSFGLFEPKR